LGGKLVHRAAQGVSLTAAGEALLQIVDPILEDYRRANSTSQL